MIQRRFVRQMLAGPSARDPTAVVDRLLAVQAQDPRGFRLAIRARTSGVTAQDIEGALNSGALVVSWLNRGTLHLVRAEDHAWLHALTTPQLRAGSTRRLTVEGVTPRDVERALQVVERELSHGPKRREDLRDAVRHASSAAAAQALVHILFRATLDGLIVRGPVIGRSQTFVLARDWLPPSRPQAPEAMLAMLARRYLAGHAPSRDSDLAYWAGVTLGTARAALREIRQELTETDDGLLQLHTRGGESPPPPPRLMGSFDPVLHGWTTRTWVTGEHDRDIVRGGMFLPFVLASGTVAGTWRLERGRPSLQPFRPLRPDEQRALDADADDVVRFFTGRPSARL